jgi:hypothetical protein
MEVHRRLLSTKPGYARRRDEIENQALRYEARELAPMRSGITHIPVVVHVVWNNADQNISGDQILSQFEVLNQDFRRKNADLSATPSAFMPLTADAKIEFHLATVDPTGAPTSGIERRQTTVESFTDDDAVKSVSTGGLDAWPADRYLNLWVCQLDGFLGYAQFPGGPAETDGVVILHSAFGTTGTAAAPFHLGRTATHEIGHWLNLHHIWGDDGTGCAGSDNVADTPNQGGSNFGTPTFPHVSCSNGPNGDMFMNYMDYVDDGAMVMFTGGQASRMQACLDGPRRLTGSDVLEDRVPDPLGPLAVPGIRPSSSPVVAWDGKRIDAFFLDNNRTLCHKWWTPSGWAPSSAPGYEKMGGVYSCAPQVVSWEPRRLDVFGTGADSVLYHKWWNGSEWGPSFDGRESLGGVCVGEPRVVSWAPGRLDVFVVAKDRTLCHKWFQGGWYPSVIGYERLGGLCFGQPEAASWGPNRLDVFVVGRNRALYHKWWDGAEWRPSLLTYELLGGTFVSSPRAVATKPNRLDVFAIGIDGGLYHKWWDVAAWYPLTSGAFEYLGGSCIGEPEVVTSGGNRIDVFVIRTDGALYHKWWDGSAWHPSVREFAYLGGEFVSPPRAVAGAKDALDVFAVGANDSALYHKWWSWTEWLPSTTGYENLGGDVSMFREQAGEVEIGTAVPVQAEERVALPVGSM